MESLSAELIEIINRNIEWSDYYHCIQVNKAWHSLFLKYLYKEVSLWTSKQLKCFGESLVDSANNEDKGNYVMTLKLHSSRSLDLTGLYSVLVDVLNHCSRIETLSLFYDPLVIKALKNCKLSSKTHLKSLGIDHPFLNVTTMGECMDCYHRFKFTLTGLKFRAPGEYPNYTAISLTNYFGSFTQLASLYVTISKKAFKKVPMFDRILKKCPKLIHIHYDGVSLNSPAIDRSKDQQSFIMEELSLWVDHFYMKDVQYIRSKFKCLKKLSLHIRGKVQDEWEVLKELSEIESTQEVETSIDMVGMDSVILFWNQTLSSSKGITGNKAYFTVSAEEDNDVLISYKKNPVTGITNIETEVFCPGDKKLLYIDYLEKIGLHLDELHFTDCDTGIQVNLEIINRLCPSLTKLKFEGDKLITNKGTPVPNLNLITFEIEGCTFGNSTVKAIETIYPSLKTLQLKSVHFSFKPNKSKINYISLPKGLLKIETSAKFYQRVIGQVMVLKEVDSLPVRSWHLCSVTKKIIITDGEEIGSVIKKLATEQLLILKSSTLEKVHLNRSL